MKKQNNDISKHRLDNHRVAPPPALWDRIEETLDEKEKKKRLFLFKKIGIAAAIFAPLVCGSLLFFNQNEVHNAEFAHIETRVVQKQTETIEKPTKSSAVAEPINQHDYKRDNDTSKPTIGNDNGVKTSQPQAPIKNNNIEIHVVSSATERQTFALLTHKTESLPQRFLTEEDIQLQEWEQDQLDKQIIAANLNRIENYNAETSRKKAMKSSIETQVAVAPLLASNSMTNGNDIVYFSMDGGINYSISNNDKIAYITGIHLSKMGKGDVGGNDVNAAPNLSFAGSPPNSNTPSREEDNDHYFDYINRSQENLSGSNPAKSRTSERKEDVNEGNYLEIPLLMRYSLVDSKFGVDMLGGIHTNFLIKGPSATNIDSYKTITNAAVVGMSFHYKMGNHFQIHIDPKAKYYTNFNENFQPFVVGLYTGMSYHF